MIEQGKWYTTNRFRELAPIKDPFEQATTNMYSFVRFLQSLAGRIPIPRVVRAVFFPDIFQIVGLYGASHPPQIVGGESDLDRQPADWIARVFDYQAESQAVIQWPNLSWKSFVRQHYQV